MVTLQVSSNVICLICATMESTNNKEMDDDFDEII